MQFYKPEIEVTEKFPKVLRRPDGDSVYPVNFECDMWKRGWISTKGLKWNIYF